MHVQFRLYGRRHLQFIKAKHGQGQQHKQAAHDADGPDILEIGLQLVTGIAGDIAGNGIGHCGAQHIADCHQAAAGLVEFLVTLANDNAG